MRRAWIAVGVWAGLSGGTAAAAPGDLLVTERTTGTVLEFGQGGDLSEAERFATGLSEPLGICVGPGGHIYVAESVVGGVGSEITIITEGGDFTDAEPFATGPAGITALWCDDETILIGSTGPAPEPGEPPTGAVFDAINGGMFLFTGEIVAFQLILPGAMARMDDGSLYSANGDVWDITAGGLFGEVPPYTTGRPLFVLEERGGMLLGGDFVAPEVVDITAGGDLTVAPVFATLPTLGTGVHGLLDAGEAGLFALVADQIFEVSSGGDHSADEPWATGLQTGQLGYHGMVHHVCSTDADCSDGDACNGAELCVNNTCLPPEQSLECDDDNVCTVDSCDADLGCSHETIADCCASDDDCSIDEFCSGSTNSCVPIEVVTGGADESTGSDTDGPPVGSTGSGGSQDTEQDTASQDGDSGGCSCRSSSRSAPWWALGLLPVLVRLRRRT